jgi:hypothetical protein
VHELEQVWQCLVALLKHVLEPHSVFYDSLQPMQLAILRRVQQALPESLQDYIWGVNVESLESIQGSPV